MPSDTAPPPSVRSLVRLDGPLREHRCAVARYALAKGRPLNLDAITAILSAKELECETERHPFTRWTTDGLVTFLWGTVAEWCATRGIAIPPSTAESLWTYLTFLDDTGELASGSARIDRLREALRENTGITAGGRARHPAGRRRGGEVRALVRR
jgi:hypothetical protein